MAEDKYNLTTNQRAFADEYIANKGNATQAYLKAYPSVTKETTANSNGSRLLRNAKVAGYIAERTKEALEAQKMTGDEIIIELVLLPDERRKRLISRNTTIYKRKLLPKQLAHSNQV